MMATMASLFPAPQVNAKQVGSFFVGQYYQIIQQNPQLGYRFYTEGSTAIRIDGKMEKTASSIMEIHDLLTTLNAMSIEIKTLHSQNSWAGGVVVVVFGFVQMKDYDVRREFVQTFFLAPQETGYFVLNDIFHLLDEETKVQQPSATILSHNNYNASHNNYDGNPDATNHHVPDPVLEYTAEEELQTGDFASPVDVIEEEPHAREYQGPLQADETDTVDNHSLPEHQQSYEPQPHRVDEIHVEEPVASFPTYEPPSVSAEESVGERPKQTYASIVRFAKAQPGSFMRCAAPMSKISPVTAAPMSKKTSVVSDTQNSTPPQPYSATSWADGKSSDTQNSTPPQPYSATSWANGKSSGSEAMENLTTAEDYSEVKSVYVKNLSASISASDIEREFKNFGVIKPSGVTVRSRKESGGYYAFVEFEDVTGVQNALQASQILVNGRQIYVEARRPNSSISQVGGGRGRGRGRGGYPTEAPRGRFGGRGFSRGNGILQREQVPRQERGILGNHSRRIGPEPI